MIIGISGKINSGKDLVGNIIQYLICLDKNTLLEHQKDFKEFCLAPQSNYIQSTFKIVKFADKLKDIVCILLGCTREQLEDRVYKETELGEEWWYYQDRINHFIYDYTTFKNLEVVKHGSLKLVKSTPRLLLQLLGTECGRQILHPNVWVNATMADYKTPYIYNSDEVKVLLSNMGFVDLENCWDEMAINEGFEYNEILDLFSFDEDNIEESNWIITDVRFPNEAKAITDKGGINIRIERNDYIFDDDGKRIIPTKEYINITNKQHESETALDEYKEWDYVIDNDGTIEDLIIKVKEILLKEKIINEIKS